MQTSDCAGSTQLLLLLLLLQSLLFCDTQSEPKATEKYIHGGIYAS